MNWLSDNVNLLSLIGAAAILVLTVGVAGKYLKQMKYDKSTGELSGDNWDGIGEYKNPLPLGWALSFVGTIIWAIWYILVGYPTNSYSQIGEYNEEVASHTKMFEAKWKNPTNETLMGMGEGIYLVQCSPCHGIAADGIAGKAAGFDVWGTEKGIVETVLKGSKGLNYPMGEMPAGLADEASAKAIAAYIMEKLSGVGAKDKSLVAQGEEAFAASCSSCHGPDGKGLDGQSPNLANYGKPEFVADVLERGKVGNIGHMPSFKGRLTDIQNQAVGTYILSFGK